MPTIIRLRTMRRALFAATLLILAATAALVAWAVMPGVERATSVPPPPPRRQRSANSLPATPTLAELRAVWQRSLRPAERVPSNVVNRAPQTVDELDDTEEDDEQMTKRLPSLGVRLVGTILESGNSKAIFVDRDGRIELRGVGGQLNAAGQTARVEEIRLASVTLVYRGRRLTLEMPRNAMPGSEGL